MRCARLLVALAAALLTAGCTSIPTSGPVQVVRTAQADDPAGPDLVSLPNPPAAGATQQQIVQGFVLAASAGGAYAVAKRFLTDDEARRWRPQQRVLVHEQPFTVRPRPGDRVELSVPVVAEVGTDGVYTPEPAGRTLRFRLVRERGQWRIAAAPDGVVLPRATFQRTFAPVSLAFFDQTFTRIVPDRRWFPVAGSSSGASTRAVLRRLLAGQAAFLAPTVAFSAFPSGSRVTGVTESSIGVVTVSVRTPGARPSATTTARMQQQITTSLQRASPSSIRLVVDGVEAPTARPLTVAGATRPVVLAGSRFGVLDDRGVTGDAVLGRRIVAARPDAVTVSTGQRLAAVRTAGGAVAVVTADRSRVVDSRPGLVRPALDQRGWVFSVPAGDPVGLRAARASGPSVPVAGSLLDGTVTSIEVSPDGTRLLVLGQGEAGPVATVAGIQRDPSGKPVGLAAERSRVVLGTNVQAISATWADDGAVAVLTGGTDRQEVVVQPLGGIAFPLGRLPGPVSSVVGGGDLEALRVLTVEGGAVYENDRNTTWEAAGTRPVDVSVLAVQR